jgi:hypothetical protein
MRKRNSSMSNIDVVKKYLAGERPYIQVSNYVTEKEKFRKEGEEWEISKIRYKKVNGKTVKLTKSQGDVIRDAIDDFLNCKECNANWKFASAIDRKTLLRTGCCQDCLITYETKLRVLGIYDSYEKYRLATYELGYLRDMEKKLTETIAYFSSNNGDIVSVAESEYDPSIIWKNTNKDKILNDAISDLKETKRLIKNGIKITRGFKKQYLSDIKQYKMKDIITSKRK